MHKINQYLPYISTNNIIKLNKLIYAGAKLVCEKTGIPQKARRKNQNQNEKFDRKRRYKNLRKQAKVIKQRKFVGICRNKKEKATHKKK